ncbi:MmpS family membrane protein [Tamaricihabitans halophyticus]|uniref:MmpS family membrane protein n=1 Tax=Tamaricihabitans halophyticus TaxID=1262583 RepID=A0A4R2RBS3_9PSEU|nr:MmpS family transport accessory protein [Tamaricihabitans halophyticus]TCP57171.1 MmpS family membrane protein [Tamaricihabitans halophyticus]
MPASARAEHPHRDPAAIFTAFAWAAFACGMVGAVGAPLLSLWIWPVIVAGLGIVLGIIAAFGAERVLALLSVGLCVVGIVFSILIRSSAPFNAVTMSAELNERLTQAAADEGFTVTYELITDVPRITAVSYRDADGEVQQRDNVSAPWSVSLHTNDFTNTQFGLIGDVRENAEITCRVLLEDRLITERTGTGSARCAA